MPQWLVVGISGVTCGGKTTLAHSLRDYFQNQRNTQLWNIGEVQMISQDDYFLPVDDLRHKWNDKLNVINFELITSVDMKQMLSDINWIMKSNINVESIENNFDYYYQQSQYNYQNNYSTQISQRPTNIIRLTSQIPDQINNKRNILIIEGFMIFNQIELLKLCHIKYHFHLPYEKCFERRSKRIYDPPDVIGYFEMCVWPHYEKNFMEFRDHNDITFLNGEMSKEKIFKFVVKQIIGYLEERFDFACPPPQKMIGLRLLSSSSCNNANNITKSFPMEQQ